MSKHNIVDETFGDISRFVPFSQSCRLGERIAVSSEDTSFDEPVRAQNLSGYEMHNLITMYSYVLYFLNCGINVIYFLIPILQRVLLPLTLP